MGLPHSGPLTPSEPAPASRRQRLTPGVPKAPRWPACDAGDAQARSLSSPPVSDMPSLSTSSRPRCSHDQQFDQVKFLDRPQLLLDTNLAEGDLRVVALIRKNTLIWGAFSAGPRAAAFLDVVRSCRLAWIDRLDYLTDVPPGMPRWRIRARAHLTATRVDALTPNAGRSAAGADQPHDIGRGIVAAYALSGGHGFPSGSAISTSVNCDTRQRAASLAHVARLHWRAGARHADRRYG